MKRALFETVAVLPLVSGSVVQRTGYESAVLALTVAQNATATVKVEHCDIQDGTFASEFLTEMSPKGGRKTHFLAQRRIAANHPIEKVGAELRKMMSWLKK